MKKNKYLFLLSLLVFLWIIPIYFKATAQVAQLIIEPDSLPKNFDGNVNIKCINSANCFPINTPLDVIVYPDEGGKTPSDFWKANNSGTLTPVNAKSIQATDVVTIQNVHLNFNNERANPKPSFIGPWNVIVCYTSNNFCKSTNSLVAKGQISILPPAPTPTPTPALDQPIIDYSQQDACTFRYTNDPNSFIEINVQNLKPDIKYMWWWNEGVLSPKKQDVFTTNDLQPAASISSQDPLWSIPIYADKLQNLTNPLSENGHLFCVDIENDGILNSLRLDSKRTGANCIRLFFLPIQPTEDQKVCSGNNLEESDPISPASPLPHCDGWEFLNGTPVPTGTDGTQGKYIIDNKLDESTGIECVSINTAIGSISTDPQAFIKRIFSVILGLAGGVALILIMIAGYKLMISQGNPEKMADAREHLTSAIVGLLFIIFSFVILQVIGVDLLKIPGFGR